MFFFFEEQFLPMLKGAEEREAQVTRKREREREREREKHKFAY